MKTNTFNQLKQILEDKLIPEEVTLKIYMLWCDSVTLKDIEFQQVLANSKINHWFNMELKKQLAEYKLLVKRYPNASKSHKIQLQSKCLYKLFSVFPKAMLIKAKQREAITLPMYQNNKSVIHYPLIDLN